jgi:hypothetical protein
MSIPGERKPMVVLTSPAVCELCSAARFLLALLFLSLRATFLCVSISWFREDEDDGGDMFFASPCPLLPFGLLAFLLPLSLPYAFSLFLHSLSFLTIS